MKLTIELVPSTSWFSNLRSLLSPEEWDKIRKGCYKHAGYKCEICNGVGPTHPVECHETWEYDEKGSIQKLIGLIALCPSCHEVKHIGLAGIKGRHGEAIAHFCKVNECSESEAEKYVKEAFATWSERSEQEWDLNIELLEELKK
jgi:5-methylcytosine-specific restriction endonuclease McrA